MKTLNTNNIIRNLTLVAAGAFMATLVAVPIGSTVSADAFNEDGDLVPAIQQTDLSGAEFNEDGDLVPAQAPRPDLSGAEFNEDGDLVPAQAQRPDLTGATFNEDGDLEPAPYVPRDFTGVEFDDEGDPVAPIHQPDVNAITFEDDED